jgi:hypothetical protein
MLRKKKGDGDSVTPKHGPVALSETVRPKKRNSTTITSDRTPLIRVELTNIQKHRTKN